MNYLKSTVLIVLVSLLGSLLRHSIAHTNLAMLYILVVVITAVRWGRGPSLYTAVLSVLIFDFFFIPPRFSMTVADTQYLIAFGTLFAVAMVISSLTLKAREQAHTARSREIQAMALYNFSRDLANIINLEDLYQTVISHVHEAFSADVAIFLREGRDIKLKCKSRDFPITGKEDEALLKILKNGINNSTADFDPVRTNPFFLSLKTSRGIFGAVGIMFENYKTLFVSEQSKLLETFVNQIAFAVERLQLLAEARQAELLRQAEKLQTAFLNSVSHDLRTPLSTITGSLSSLLEGVRMSERDRHSLIESAYEESSRLNQLVSDLLDMARVEAGALYLQKKLTDIRDLVGAALKKTDRVLKDFRVSVRIPENLPEVRIDFVHMMKALTNILDNAIKYSRSEKAIDIEAEQREDFIRISISDRGIGIPASDLKLVFDKFYRIKRPQQQEGTGLGLSVSKGIVQAHRGTITAENRPEGGTVIRIMIPSRQE